jgi:hypothetical protein
MRLTYYNYGFSKIIKKKPFVQPRQYEQNYTWQKKLQEEV